MDHHDNEHAATEQLDFWFTSDSTFQHDSIELKLLKIQMLSYENGQELWSREISEFPSCCEKAFNSTNNDMASEILYSLPLSREILQQKTLGFLKCSLDIEIIRPTNNNSHQHERIQYTPSGSFFM